MYKFGADVVKCLKCHQYFERFDNKQLLCCDCEIEKDADKEVPCDQS